MRGKVFERLANYLYGYVRVSIKGYTSRALTAMLHSGIDYRELVMADDGIEFNMAVRYRRALKRVLSGIGCTVTFSSQVGMLSTVRRYRHRPGIIVGALIFATVLWASTRFVWDISVEGNDRLSDYEIIESFSDFGLNYGSFIPSIDFDRLCHEYLIASDELSFASVNMEGTRACIVVKERTDRTDTWQTDTPSDIIAAEDGQIVTFAVWSGESRIHLGQVVRKGDILIAGTKEKVENETAVGYDIVRSYGTVQAQVYREYTVEVPLVGTQKVYTGEEKTEKQYKFFTKALKTFGNSGNNDEFYDKIEANERVVLFGVVKLPIFADTVVYREYTEEPYEYTEAQAAQVAEAKMMKVLSEELYGCELLSKKSTGTCEDGVYTLKCGVYCIADIAKEVEIQSGEENGELGID